MFPKARRKCGSALCVIVIILLRSGLVSPVLYILKYELSFLVGEDHPEVYVLRRGKVVLHTTTEAVLSLLYKDTNVLVSYTSPDFLSQGDLFSFPKGEDTVRTHCTYYTQ